jgi:hypothetical protein
MIHPLVVQLRFTRSEFQRALESLPDEDAKTRILPMNCISWNVGHLAWQEQRYFLTFAQDKVLLPRLNEEFRYGGPASTPSLVEMQEAWRTITSRPSSTRVPTKESTPAARDVSSNPFGHAAWRTPQKGAGEQLRSPVVMFLYATYVETPSALHAVGNHVPTVTRIPNRNLTLFSGERLPAAAIVPNRRAIVVHRSLAEI